MKDVSEEAQVAQGALEEAHAEMDRLLAELEEQSEGASEAKE